MGQPSTPTPPNLPTPVVKRVQEEEAVQQTAMDIAEIIAGKGYIVEVAQPHLVFLPGCPEQLAVRIRFIAPRIPQGREAVVIFSEIEKMLKAANELPSARMVGMIQTGPLASRPLGGNHNA